jgi:hypothetical protein
VGGAVHASEEAETRERTATLTRTLTEPQAGLSEIMTRAGIAKQRAAQSNDPGIALFEAMVADRRGSTGAGFGAPPDD